MTPFLLTIPFITGLLNRAWRGEGTVPRWLWYSCMTVLGTELSGDYRVAPIWLLFLLGYALGPWQSMFCAITDKPYGRADNMPWRIMQNLALLLTFNTNGWYVFGVVYGTIRACLMLPGIFALCWFYHSDFPLYGLPLLGMGLVYFFAGKVANHEGAPNIAVALAEFTMGWGIGTYMLIVGQL